jgi:hypothetical protein
MLLVWSAVPSHWSKTLDRLCGHISKLHTNTADWFKSMVTNQALSLRVLFVACI